MSLSTYTELKASIADWLGRSDLTNQIVDFIALAEAEFNNNLRMTDMLDTNTVTTTANTATAALPSDFLSIRQLYHSTEPRKMNKTTLDVIFSKYNSAYSGRPVDYAIHVGNTVYLGPVPDAVYSLNLIYYKKVPALASNSTNWLLTKKPNAYLYGALRQARIFMQDEELVQRIEAEYASNMSDLMAADKRNILAGVAMRVSGATP